MTESESALRDRIRSFPDEPERQRWNRDNLRYFSFDVLLTNPPFAGKIKDSRIIQQYDVARPEGRKWAKAVSREVLFVERNLEFLRPGGRMAIVMPQGRLNNVTDGKLRAFIHEHARLLASVSLGVSTFKPHTNTKTSVLFLQKWNDDPDATPNLRCPHVDDYPVLFAVSQRSGKDSRGEYVYLTDDQGDRVEDMHAHPIVDHDLFNLREELRRQMRQRLDEVETEDERRRIREEHDARVRFVPERTGVAEAFREWGKRNGLAFCIENQEEEVV